MSLEFSIKLVDGNKAPLPIVARDSKGNATKMSYTGKYCMLTLISAPLPFIQQNLKSTIVSLHKDEYKKIMDCLHTSANASEIIICALTNESSLAEIKSLWDIVSEFLTPLLQNGLSVTHYKEILENLTNQLSRHDSLYDRSLSSESVDSYEEKETKDTPLDEPLTPILSDDEDDLEPDLSNKTTREVYIGMFGAGGAPSAPRDECKAYTKPLGGR